MARVDVTAETDPAVSGLPRGPVEARSLSSITAIASNPPAYPRNPTQTRLDPLSLYIVRVPGSKGKCLVYATVTNPSSPLGQHFGELIHGVFFLSSLIDH